MELKLLYVIFALVLVFEVGYWLGQVDERQDRPIAKCLNDDSIRVLKAEKQPIPRCDP